ncbi:MAG: hypothetical protein OMM_00129 [Candidatus Magnetoglobus multicellularis str. Araruama]|uniref:Uncharacterized protein n=1 Tax=Candidatus Magnetoglobus multicellularis str. Araruama TaxID=890399 RepID=A0A1V1PIN0_9BACT|nr:MAG: hypothetical protein OMM_00129 [Candidatus Magnetoglobus multicellularis str. Araruama]
MREFLNYETNECKLLQIVIFAQQEFKAILEAHANFSDRVNICHELEPLGFFDTIKKIQFRLNKASEGRATPNIFTWPAFWAVYVATRGYPRKILHLCHLVLLGLIIQNKTRVNYFLVRSCVKRDTSGRYFQPRIFRNLILMCCVCFVMSWGYKNVLPDRLKFFSFHQVHQWFSIFNNKNAKTLDTLAEANLQDNSFQMPEDDHEDKSPVILGKITCLRHETMQNLIQLFYGTYNPWYLRYVKMVNPHIHNTLSIERGQTVHFPGVPVTSPGLDHSPNNNLWWIELARFKHIHEAYSYYINYPNDAPEIMILPYWNQKAGLNFSVLYSIPFQDPTAATRFIDQFPQYISQNCRLRNKWVKGTTFFSKRMIDLSF